jgi:hypothetical protein
MVSAPLPIQVGRPLERLLGALSMYRFVRHLDRPTLLAMKKRVFWMSWSNRFWVGFFALTCIGHGLWLFESWHPMHAVFIGFGGLGLGAMLLQPYYAAWKLVRTSPEIIGTAELTLDDAGFREKIDGGIEVFVPWDKFRKVTRSGRFLVVAYRSGARTLMEAKSFPEEALAFFESRVKRNESRP